MNGWSCPKCGRSIRANARSQHLAKCDGQSLSCGKCDAVSQSLRVRVEHEAKCPGPRECAADDCPEVFVGRTNQAYCSRTCYVRHYRQRHYGVLSCKQCGMGLHPSDRSEFCRSCAVQRRIDSDRLSSRKRRAALNGAPIFGFSNTQLLERLSMFFGCWMCGAPFEAADHVKPVSRGGYHLLSNLRPACKSCNSHKKAKWPIDLSEWRRPLLDPARLP